MRNRSSVEGILWLLLTGARWRDLLAEYPSGITCWRRLRRWEDEGVWLEGQQLLAALNHQQLLQWDEPFLDGRFVSAKKRVLLSEAAGISDLKKAGRAGRKPRLRKI